MTPEEMKDFEEAITSQGGQLSCVVAAGPNADVQQRVRRRGNREFAAVLEQPWCGRMR